MTDVPDRLTAALAGRYTIERELGRGGMAVVYLARDERHQRLVALKVMLPEVVGEEGAQRFQREIQLAARLTHPNIVTVFDSGDADGLVFYAMSFVEGESLHDAIDRAQQLSIGEAVSITRQLADALDYAHAEGVIHRDIKPANILLARSPTRRSSAGGPRTPVLTDFGIARAMSGDSAATRLTATGLMVGTPMYMSPEQWGGEKIDGRSDQYSLACVLYEMLIGEPPFTGPNPMVVFARHTSEMVPSLRIVRSTVPEALEQAIYRAMSKMAADRFDTMADFSDAIVDAIEAPIVYGTGDYRVTGSNLPVQRTRPSESGTLGRGELRKVAGGAVDAPAQNAVVKYEPPQTSVATVQPAGQLRAYRRAIAIGAATLALAGASAASWRVLRPTPHVRLMVFPFRNSGPVGDSTFADGLTEELISRLSGVARLSVVARTSAMKYKGTMKTGRELAKELNVDKIVRGTVKWKAEASDSRQATVSVSIENTDDDTEKPVDDFDAANLNNLYDIASKVAARLDVTTGMETKERQRLADRPTQNRDAYDAYVQGNRFYNHSWGEADVRNAIDSYQRATFLDPNFALAFAALGRANGWISQLGIDRNPNRFALAKQYIDSALRISPELPEAHLARGLLLYWKDRDYDGALREFRQVQNALPSSAETFNVIGNIYRRKGALKEAVESYATAADLDPRAQQTVFNRAETLLYLREFEASELLANKVIELAPDFIDGPILKATLQIHRASNVAAARKILADLETRISGANWRTIGHHWRAGLFRIIDDSLATAERRVVVNTFGLDTAQYFIARAEVYHRFGQKAKATAYYDSATAYMELTVQRHPEWGSAHGQLGVAAAGLQRKDLAVQSAEKAATMLNATSDALDGPEWVANVAMVYTMVGDKSKALDWLERAMTMPSRLSPRWIALDPVWATLRDEPRFKRLVDQPPALVSAATAAK